MTLRRLALALVSSLAAGEALAAPQVCNVKLNVTDQDPAGLNVRATPQGRVIGTLKAKGQWVQVDVVGAAGAWAQIRSATYMEKQPDPRGIVGINTSWDSPAAWVAFSKLGISELDDRAFIRDAPAEGAKTLLVIDDGGDEAKLPPVEVLGCAGDFLKVRVKGVVGWTREFCSNEFTTCV